ncbi:MAG: hypothetical protein KF726_12680 [Anaerolineae bacterium]|nr:hypothetical protein [Anaerolineae bacterium]
MAGRSARTTSQHTIMKSSVRFVDIPFNSQNILELPDPEDWTCRVWRYHVSHSELVIRLSNKNIPFLDQSIYVCLESVYYFQGSTGFVGANFTLGSPEDIVQTWGLLGQSERDGLAIDEYRQYVLEEIRVVKIMTADQAAITILTEGGIAVTDVNPLRY